MPDIAHLNIGAAATIIVSSAESQVIILKYLAVCVNL